MKWRWHGSVVVEQVHEPNERLVFLGAIGVEGRLIPGEWMGYTVEDYDDKGPQKYPCVLVTDHGGSRFDFCGWRTWDRDNEAFPGVQLRTDGAGDSRRGARCPTELSGSSAELVGVI